MPLDWNNLSELRKSPNSYSITSERKINDAKVGLAKKKIHVCPMRLILDVTDLWEIIIDVIIDVIIVVIFLKF